MSWKPPQQSAFTSEELISRALRGELSPFAENEAYTLLKQGRINIEQYILVMNYTFSQNRSVRDVMAEIGLSRSEDAVSA